MPKVLRAYNTDYKIAVRENGEITLDVGPEGTVIVTGNLNIQGETTTVNTVDLEIEDNIILLNKGDASGVTEGTSGIEIDRGSLVNARWVYDENISWTLGGLSSSSLPAGTFYGELNGQKLPINTPGIVAQGTLYVDTGAGVISVTNTPDYEEKIFNYSNGVIEPDTNGRIVIDDDNIPNTKAIKDYVDYNFNNRAQSFVAEGDTNLRTIDEIHEIESIVAINPEDNNTTVIETAGPHGFVNTDTVDITNVNSNGDNIENLNGIDIGIIEIINQNTLRLNVDTTGGNTDNYITRSGTIAKSFFQESRIALTVQGDSVADFYNNRLDVFGIELKDTQISTTESNSDLTLKAPGTGSIKIDDILELTSLPFDDDLFTPPLSPSEGVKLYSNSQGTGKTGLYYVNSNNVNDEIVSKNRSLLFSMLF